MSERWVTEFDIDVTELRGDVGPIAAYATISDPETGYSIVDPDTGNVASFRGNEPHEAIALAKLALIRWEREGRQVRMGSELP